VPRPFSCVSKKAMPSANEAEGMAEGMAEGGLFRKRGQTDVSMSWPKFAGMGTPVLSMMYSIVCGGAIPINPST